jgi:hypothetical protein
MRATHKSPKVLQVNGRPEAAKYFEDRRQETASCVGVTLPIGIKEMASGQDLV